MTGLDQEHAVSPTGLSIVYEPAHPSLDIVFIHGFAGHPEHTWTFNDGIAGQPIESPPSKVRKTRKSFSRHHPNSEDAVPAIYWPQDLLPKTASSARILTYGYDTRIWHQPGTRVDRTTVYNISWDLLLDLRTSRETDSSRPVLFVAHGLGGIIVEETLWLSRSCQMGGAQHCDIFHSTIGIVFFGTPHPGADTGHYLQRIAERSINVAGLPVDEHLINAFLPSTEHLEELAGELGPMARERKWVIHSFQEQVVGDTASLLDAQDFETVEHIERAHMEMCRFAGLEDVEYGKVASALLRITNMSSRQLSKEKRSPLSEEQKSALLQSLKFDQINTRQMTAKKAHPQTCKWLLGTSEYFNWLDDSKFGEHRGLLWIKGNPGSGKSMLMKFALGNAEKKMKDHVVISFFFNARGNQLERSAAGMYRSLLLQLLERLPAFQEVFESLGSKARQGGHQQWSTEALKTLLVEVVQNLGQLQLICFIDALDECDEAQIHEVTSFLEHLGELAFRTNPPLRFRVCFSSRPSPYVSIDHCCNLVLEERQEHSKDIARYVDSELKIGKSKQVQQIRADLQEKASGIFMWVVLVTEILNKEHKNGYTIPKLGQRLRDIPGDLHGLLCDILSHDDHDRDELLLCIQWVLFARQPLKLEQLYFAILSGTKPEAASEWNSRDTTAAIMERFIRDSSKGLVEITKAKQPTAQFVHKSVKDFLLKENGLRIIWPDLGENVAGVSHERLKQCCLNNFRPVDIAASLQVTGILPVANTREAAQLRQSANEKFPFLEYATRNVLYHADAAERGGVSQAAFLQRFQQQLSRWVKLDNLFERHEVRRHALSASLLYILSIGDMGALISTLPFIEQSCFEAEDERYGTPFFAALANDSDKTVEVFVRACSETQPQESPLRGLCSNFLRDRKKSITIGRNFAFGKKKNTLAHILDQENEAFLALFIASGRLNAYNDFHRRGPLSHAAERGYEAIVRLCLEMDNVDIDSKGTYRRTPLSFAAEKGREAIVRLLLKSGRADVNSNGYLERTPLMFAAREGHETVVRLLLEEGQAYVGPKDYWNQTPLSHAASNGHVGIVRLLLDKGGQADIDLKNKYGQTPLYLAARAGHEAVVRLLFETGQVDVDAMSDCGVTPLWAAAMGLRENATVVEMLLKTGQVNVGVKNNENKTPLMDAAGQGHEAVVRLLLETGQVDVNARDLNGRTALSRATERNQHSVVRLLESYGAKD